MFFSRYEVRPAPRSEHFATVGGAYANCLVVAASAAQAQAAAMRNFAVHEWEVVTVEQAPTLAARDNSFDAEWPEWYDTALRHGACYVYFEWPPEAQEDDRLH